MKLAPLDVEIRYAAFLAYGHHCFLYTYDTHGRCTEQFRPLPELLEALQLAAIEGFGRHETYPSYKDSKKHR